MAPEAELTREHGGASGQHGVGVQVLPDVDVALHDGVVGRLVDTSRLHTQERRLEERLGAPEALVADGDDLTVGQLIALLEGRGRGSGLHLSLEVERHVAELLLDVAHDLTLGGRGEGVATLSQDLWGKKGVSYNAKESAGVWALMGRFQSGNQVWVDGWVSCQSQSQNLPRAKGVLQDIGFGLKTRIFETLYKVK